jgi:hypothetical protein
MSCLFDSFERCLQQIGIHETSYNLRQKICSYLATNPVLMDDIRADTIISWDSNLNLEQYVNRMRLPSSWGGAVEIRCFVNLFCINVEVLNIRPVNQSRITMCQIIEFIRPDAENKIKVSWNGYHYEPLIN